MPTPRKGLRGVPDGRRPRRFDFDAQPRLPLRHGHGVAQDYAKAREWFEKAAGKGEREGHDVTSAGFMQRSGRGAGLRQGARVVREGRRQGRRERHADLGVLYDNGLGVAQDYAKAREWYEKAADKDDAYAMRNLGLLYANGQGVAQDYAKAREWYEKAADKGERERHGQPRPALRQRSGRGAGLRQGARVVREGR